MVLMLFSFVLRGAFAFLIGNFNLDKTLIDDSVKNDDWVFPVWVILWYAFEDILPVVIQVLLANLIISEVKASDISNFNKTQTVRFYHFALIFLTNNNYFRKLI